MEHEWWPDKPVLEVKVEGKIDNREQAFALSAQVVDQIEKSMYKHVIVVLDLTALGQSPTGAALLGGNLPRTHKIEHLVMINAPAVLRIATVPLFKLRHKLHFVDGGTAAHDKAIQLLAKLPE